MWVLGLCFILYWRELEWLGQGEDWLALKGDGEENGAVLFWTWQ